MAISTNLTQRLGIEHPVLLAPMGFVAGGALAAAVSAAGGFGMIGGGYADPDWLEREFAAAAGHRPIGCGFITWALAERPASLDVALKHQPAAIMLSFGDAAPFLPTIKRAGALAMCQVQSLAQARAVLREGADIIVAQGTEAGGHGGGRSTRAWRCWGKPRQSTRMTRTLHWPREPGEALLSAYTKLILYFSPKFLMTSSTYWTR
jgi:nitronate monooxygenase